VPFGTSPLPGKGRWPNSDGRKAGLVHGKSQWIGKEPPEVRGSILWGRRGKVRLRGGFETEGNLPW